MTMSEAIGRIAQIQATIAQLDGVTTGTTVKTGGATASGSAASTDFADVLTQALGAAAPTGTATAPGPSAGGVTGEDVVADAKKYLGVPYVFGGTTSAGIDCSGLVQRVYKDLGIDVPRLVSGQSTVGTEVPSIAQAQPGDLIVTNGGEHIVIYAGDGKVIHAPSEGRNVSLVDNWMDDSDIVTIRRLVPQASAQAEAPATTASVSAAQAAALRTLFSSMLSGSSFSGASL
jgi:cell wall-associated NlpC family hydrolase